jgi:hypothetical protein
MDGDGVPLSATVLSCLLRSDRVEGARAYAAEHAIDLADDTWTSPMVWCHAAEAALELGDTDLARRATRCCSPSRAAAPRRGRTTR